VAKMPPDAGIVNVERIELPHIKSKEN